MSIVIKGEKMPKNCIECKFQFGGYCTVAPGEVDETRVAPTVDEAVRQGKPEWCPVVPVAYDYWEEKDLRKDTLNRLKEYIKRRLHVFNVPYDKYTETVRSELLKFRDAIEDLEDKL